MIASFHAVQVLPEGRNIHGKLVSGCDGNTHLHSDGTEVNT